jgi:hypothetical protein
MGFNVRINLKKSGYADHRSIAEALRHVLVSTTRLDTVVKVNEVYLDRTKMPQAAPSYNKTNNRENRKIQNKSTTNVRK